MIKGRVRFWDLGRGKAKGEFEIKCQTTEQFNKCMEKEFSKYLMSSDISFDNGIIVVGGFRSVGKYEFIAVEGSAELLNGGVASHGAID